MCGIAGYLLKAPSYEALRKIPTLLKSIRQRGPDDEGVCLISRKNILRKAMEPYLPEKIVWRKTKLGFPFAYERFLTLNRSLFETRVNHLGNFWVRDKESGDYNNILNRDPLKLWRLCSTALWLEDIASMPASAREPRASL